MKKLLTMALALVMILSLFAVPAMAATNLLPDGDFEDYDVTDAVTTSTSVNNSAVSTETANSSNTKFVRQNGSMVLQLGTTGTVAQYIAAPVTLQQGTTYTVSADVYVNSAVGGNKGSVKFLNLGAKLNRSDNTDDVVTAAVGGSSTEFYVPFGDWYHLETTITPTATALKYLKIEMKNSSGTSEVLGYLDNVTIAEYVAPTVFDVTITGENAVTRLGAATSEGEEVIFIAKPKFGYYIESITIGGEDFLGFDAYKGGTYSTGEISADTEIVVTTAALSTNTEEGVATEVATLPAVFAPAADTAVTFGKVLDNTGATSWGVELKKDGVGVTPANGGSYLYKALATNANGQYAIEFVGLEAGTYQIRSYIYVDGTAVFGAPTTFVVD